MLQAYYFEKHFDAKTRIETTYCYNYVWLPTYSNISYIYSMFALMQKHALDD